MEEKDPKKFKEGWCVKITDENKHVLEDWRLKQPNVNTNHNCLDMVNFYLVNYHRDNSYLHYGTPDGKEISFEDFKKYILMETEFKVGDRVEIIDNGFNIQGNYKGAMKVIESIEFNKGGQKWYVTFTDGGYGGHTYKSMSDCFKLIEEKKYTLKECAKNNIAIWCDTHEKFEKIYRKITNSAQPMDKFEFDGDYNVVLPRWSTGRECITWGWNKSSIDKKKGIYSNAKTITFEQLIDFQEDMKEKQIIGYKLIKPEYKEAALKICNTVGNWENSLAEYDISTTQTGYINVLKKVNVLDLWFAPVYEPEFKVGDWIFTNEKGVDPNNHVPDYGGAGFKPNTCFKISRIDNFSNYSVYWVEGSNGLGIYSGNFRKASEEEIRKAQIRTLTIGDKKIEVVITDKIVAERREIDPKSLSQLCIDMESSKYDGIPWSTKTNTITIGCSLFKRDELIQVLSIYDEINSTDFQPDLPF